MENDNKYMVCVSSITFNQARYIDDTLNGFCIQQTNFPFVCVIVDDASTDGEQRVINKYLEQHFNLNDDDTIRREETDDYNMTFARHKENPNCYFAIYYLKYNHYSIKKGKGIYFSKWREIAKYGAECEGDDYWIDPLKLQKQIDFMEAHPQHSLCFCANQRLLPSGEIAIDKRYERDVEICPMKDVILEGGGYMATNSMLYRNSMYVPYSTWAVGCPIGDLPLMLTLANRGKVGYLADVMCVYRINSSGSWSQRMSADRKKRSLHYRSIIKMWHQFDEWSDGRYHEAVVKKIRKNMANHYMGEVKSLIRRILNK